MSRERTKRGRLQQITRWLNDQFPPPYPTRLILGKMPLDRGGLDFGVTWHYQQEDGTENRLTVKVEIRRDLAVCIDTLLHEWAHVRISPIYALSSDEEAEHDPKWAVEYGRIYESFHTGGHVDSRDY